MIWEVPKIWEGQEVYVIGGGPSLNLLDLSLIHNKNVVGVNNAYRLGNWVDICWFGDSRWLNWHNTFPEFIDGWKTFNGIKASCIAKVKDDPEIKYVEMSRKQQGIETNPKQVCWNTNSGTSAINLCYHLGAKRIILLGFDMKLVNFKQNWHDEHIYHPKKKNPYPKFLKCFEAISNDLKKLNVEIINTCMDSDIPESLISKKEYLEII